MPTKPLRRRAFEGLLSQYELAFIADEECPGDINFEWLHLEIDLMNRADIKSAAGLAWRTGSPNMLRAWIRNFPGSRPKLWWLYDTPEPLRRIVAGSGEPFLWSADRGKATAWFDWSDDLSIESQSSFLRRHNLLTAAERSRIPSEAFAPEVIFPRSELPKFEHGRKRGADTE